MSEDGRPKTDAPEADAAAAANQGQSLDDLLKPGADAEPAAVKLEELTPEADALAVEADAEAAEPTPSAPPADDRVAILEAEVANLKDQLLRAVADVQNARKRAERDRKDAETYGGVKLARDVLTVYDNLDQAIKLASPELRESEPGFFNGVDLTRKELVNAFAKHKITPIAPEKGERFDPNRHQAMFEAPIPGAEPGTVIEVMQTGFMIADRLLRPAMVGVAKAGADAAAG